MSKAGVDFSKMAQAYDDSATFVTSLHCREALDHLKLEPAKHHKVARLEYLGSCCFRKPVILCLFEQILDIAAGTGAFALLAAAELKAKGWNGKVLATDTVKAMLDLCDAHAAKRGLAGCVESTTMSGTVCMMTLPLIMLTIDLNRN